MRDEWYGDKRDLVKWGVLLHLAKQHGVKKILQVAYLRPSTYGMLEIDGESHEVPEPVLGHFRCIGNIKDLKVPGLEIELLEMPLDDRASFARHVALAIESMAGDGPNLVFLDPDTGLQPQRPNLTHVLDEELAAVHASLAPGDLLVLYQHETNRRGQPWVSEKREQFENVLGLPRGTAKVASGSEIAGDLALYYCVK
jgi:hypothetical protein